jgi:hypothetical protein
MKQPPCPRKQPAAPACFEKVRDMVSATMAVILVVNTHVCFKLTTRTMITWKASRNESKKQSTFSFPPPYSTASCHSVPSLGQAFVHHGPYNLQPKPFRQFFHADGELLELKARDFHD